MLQTIDEQRENYIISLTHDLKTPTIAQIKGLEILLNGTLGNLSDKQKELINMILDSCKYSKSLLSTVLSNYSGPENYIESVSLEQIVNDVIQKLFYIAKEKNITIIRDFQIISELQLNKTQIQRVIVNFLSNAIKYAYNNTMIIVRIFQKENYVYFEFQNDSPYIPINQQQNLFHKYVSYANCYNKIGTGIGLYSSKKIIEDCHGHIYMHSMKEDKNIFGFFLPVN